MSTIFWVIFLLMFFFYIIKKVFSFNKSNDLKFRTAPLPDHDFDKEIKDFLDKKYSPRSGQLVLEIPLKKKIKLDKAGSFNLIFREKASYYQDMFWSVGVTYNNNLVGIAEEIYDSKKPLIRIVRAYYSGFDINVSLNKLGRNSLELNVELIRDGNIVETKAKRGKSKKIKGEFNVAGYAHLDDDVKRIVWKELIVGAPLKLYPDPDNKYDTNAVKVFYKEHFIGWVPKDYVKKNVIYDNLISKNEIHSYCLKNDRRPSHQGMAQYVIVKFEMDNNL